VEGKISHRWSRLEQGKIAFLATLSSWNEVQLHSRRSPGCWSALEVLDHVVKTESAFLAEMSKASAGSGRRPGLPDRMRGVALVTMMSLPVRVKVPAAAAMVLPDTLCEWNELRIAWDTVRARLLAWIEQNAASVDDRGLVRHPVSGWLSLSQSLAFLAAHLQHHRYQLQRIQRSHRQPSTLNAGG
jgi:uncharacterized damage-inducible protein DinB